VHVAHGRGDTVMAQQLLQCGEIPPAFHRMGGEGMPVLISILPMKCPRSRFTIVTIRFTENTGRSFAGYGGTRATKSSLRSVTKCR
jgi:hypothetical protein